MTSTGPHRGIAEEWFGACIWSTLKALDPLPNEMQASLAVNHFLLSFLGNAVPIRGQQFHDCL